MIRALRVSDLFLAQRLLRHSARLNPVRSLLNPRTPLWMALLPTHPLDEARLFTYLLYQRENSVARTGMLQAQKRPGRPEADITLLTPRLDAPIGHPAIWQKLLSHFSEEAVRMQISRIYAMAPDEPTVVYTLSSVGFRVYSHQTIWRLTTDSIAAPTDKWKGAEQVRPQHHGDEWGLMRLYNQSTPHAVQMAEGAHTDKKLLPPILDGRMAGHAHTFVLNENGKLRGCIKVAVGRLGCWLQLWFDPQLPASTRIQQLLHHGVHTAWSLNRGMPMYVGVDEYQGGLASILVDYGFAPFTDVVKTVRPTVQRVVEPRRIRVPLLEPIPTVASVPYHRRPAGTYSAITGGNKEND